MTLPIFVRILVASQSGSMKCHVKTVSIENALHNVLFVQCESHVSKKWNPKTTFQWKKIVFEVIFPLLIFRLKTLKLSIFRHLKRYCRTLKISKHCQRHNGPEGWVLLTKVNSFGHITSSYTNLDQTSSEYRPSTNFKISIKLQHFDWN